MKGPSLYRMSIFLVGEREELDKIETKFQWIKANLGINKTELYKEALIWISNNEKAKIKFMEHLIKEKAQEHQLFISK